MRLLVTGGAGFIGSNFLLQCLAEGAGIERIVNLDKLTYAGNPANLADAERDARYNFVQGDIGDRELVGDLLMRHKITAIANFAAESHVDRSIDGPEAFIETNVAGTLRLLDTARHYWKGLPDAERKAFRFLHVSTDEVFGSLGPEEPAFTEATPFAPNSPYAASKASSDHLVRAYHHTYGLPVLTTNCSNNYGPYQFPEKLIPLMILNALEGKDLPIYGDGRNVRDWLYVEDHCRAIRLVIEQGRIGETYNVGGMCERQNIKVVDCICELLDELAPRSGGQSYREQKSYVRDRPGHDRRYAIDCSKLAGELGWKPLESFETGIRKTVAWYLAHRPWCENITSGKYQRQRLGTEVGI
ncbi:MAG TPA: dTDP-glucose 4,6-dehydratase [Chthoniobacteraceae bacterium]|jgi:dTDP-glucose 4,6-dehydratase|nr:dTDP-glucose 4,6-dehydratase [Chthoniobacteraceae bacterium]